MPSPYTQSQSPTAFPNQRTSVARDPQDPESLPKKRRRFETTHWSLIREAQETLSPGSQAALKTLCQTYWFPVGSAEDLTQGFFVQLLEKKSLKAADRDRGRFRSFLLTAVKFFLADEWDRQTAQKRGGGATPIELDFADGQARHLEPRQDLTPEAVFELQWAYTLLDQVMEQLRVESAQQDQLENFETLRGFLGGAPELSQTDAAEQLGITPGAVRVRVHRLRKKFGRLLRDKIADTVGGPSEVDDEVRHLIGILAG